MKFLRFDDKQQRTKMADGTYVDKLVHIREVFRIFTRNTKNNYNSGEFLTIDEILLPFRGRCPFRMFIPSKKAKFGIKIFCVVDPSTLYLVNSGVYLGKQGGEGDKNLGENVVFNLAMPFFGTGRTLVSAHLGKELWSKKTHLLGTVHLSIGHRWGATAYRISSNCRTVSNYHTPLTLKTYISEQSEYFAKLFGAFS